MLEIYAMVEYILLALMAANFPLPVKALGTTLYRPLVYWVIQMIQEGIQEAREARELAAKKAPIDSL